VYKLACAGVEDEKKRDWAGHAREEYFFVVGWFSWFSLDFPIERIAV
jgi:hypothetical protein